jgi:hypothetical protein
MCLRIFYPKYVGQAEQNIQQDHTLTLTNNNGALTYHHSPLIRLRNLWSHHIRCAPLRKVMFFSRIVTLEYA